jgi:hypothetical protein
MPKTIEQCAALRGRQVDDLKKELTESRVKLLSARDQRVRPGKDDKVLVSWNALMIEALARASHAVRHPEFLIAAEKAANFILNQMSRADGRLLHTWRHGEARLDAYLDDYSYFINALVTLYEATFNERWIEEAVRLADLLLAHFEDHDRGGFYFTADDHEQLIARNKDLHDASVPSGNAMAATALIRLGKLCGRTDYLQAAGRTLAVAAAVMERSPAGAGQMLIALDMWLGPMQELVLIGGADDTANQSLIESLMQSYLPNSVRAHRRGGTPPAAHSPALDSLFTGRIVGDQQPSLFVCENSTCQAPISGRQEIAAALKRMSGPESS